MHNELSTFGSPQEIEPLVKCWGKPRITKVSWFAILVIMFVLYTYIELGGFLQFLDMTLGGFTTLVVLGSIIYGSQWLDTRLRPVRTCSCGSTMFNVVRCDDEYVDTTPRRIDGEYDRRHHRSGYTIKHYKFDCLHCGNYHRDFK